MSQKKQIFKLSNLKEFLNDSNSCVSLVPSTRLLALPPFFLNDMKSGIFYLLNSILKKYDRSLDGILMGYQNVKILMDENTGIIPIGSAETEVNVSVECYIFQPKIGNTLEGVINKKSKNHIGCLVHRYFNATILKPDNVEYQDWNCKDFDINDKILFKVKDLDFTGFLPYIEGTVSEDLVDCAKPKRSENCDSNHKKPTNTDNKMNRLLDSVLNEKEVGRKKKKKKKSKEKNDAEEEKFQDQSSREVIVNNRNLESESSDSHSKREKKKKKKSKEKNDAEEEKFQDQSSREVIVNNRNLESESSDSHSKREKKKKKKKEKDATDEKSLDISKKKEEETVVPEFNSQKHLDVDDENDFVKKPIQSTKGKKKKEGEANPSRNKTSEGPTHQDELFYSTQLEPHLESKMNTSCSPIPKAVGEADLEKSVVGKEKRKERKRKADDSGDAGEGERVKREESQMNGSADFVDELLRRELRNVIEELKISERKKREKEKCVCENLMTETKNEMERKKNKEGDSDSSRKKKKKKKQKHEEEKFRNGSVYDAEMTREKWSVDKSLFSDSEQSYQSQSQRSPAKGKHVNGVSPSQKSLLQTMLDQFFLEEGKKLRIESDRESLKEEKRGEGEEEEEKGGEGEEEEEEKGGEGEEKGGEGEEKGGEGEEEEEEEEEENSLYEKLLREARSRIEVMEDSPPPKKKRK